MLWNVWDMTNGDEWTVKADCVEDFTASGMKEVLDSKYDMIEEKWYFYLRGKEYNTIYRINEATRKSPIL